MKLFSGAMRFFSTASDRPNSSASILEAVDESLGALVLRGFEAGHGIKLTLAGPAKNRRIQISSDGTIIGGPPGLGIDTASVSQDGDLILTLSDGSTINAGHVVGPQGASAGLTRKSFELTSTTVVNDSGNPVPVWSVMQNGPPGWSVELVDPDEQMVIKTDLTAFPASIQFYTDYRVVYRRSNNSLTTKDITVMNPTESQGGVGSPFPFGYSLENVSGFYNLIINRTQNWTNAPLHCSITDVSVESSQVVRRRVILLV